MVRMTLSALIAFMLLAPAPTLAQWLGPHVDSQRWSNLRKHQQKVHRRNVEKANATTSKAQRQDNPAPKLTSSERQSAWSRHKGEYRKRLLRDGQASADRWLDQTAISER